MLSISQSSDEVYVIARLAPSRTTSPLSTSPFHVVRVRKDSLTFRGNIRFWLLDESGKRRSVRTGTISAPWTLPPGTDLPFDTVWTTDEYWDPRDPREPGIQVVAADPHRFVAGIPANAQAEIDKVDFSKYLAVVVFRGLAGPDFPVTVETIRQTGDVIYVVAWFDPGPQVSVPINSSPFHIVKVDKDNLTSRGSITFRLLDEESGRERANVSVTVP